ncbi:sugar O-acetyltransferase [Photobacterium leiognathi]|uniref:sugar O-acetyltransferase n=1 Tax=Photobacterium leiognathi TaxID=553611 RepID=UPI0029827F76|nr:sugar O-acetyltransferase [Photobacterium leiognathi]
MNEFEKMLAGKDFDGNAECINDIRQNAANLLQALNHNTDDAQRCELLQQLMGTISSSSIVRSPFYCEFGKTISIGEKTFINMNVTMLDGAKITIGNNVMIGPNTQLYCAGHDLNHLKRRNWETICDAITIEDDVWIGGNVVINKGVTIGARSVIAANSVVNSNVPPDSLYGGTPAKLIRRLNK